MYRLITLLIFTTFAFSRPADVIEGAWIAEFQHHKWERVSESLWMTLRAGSGEDRHGFNFNLPIRDLEGLNVGPGHDGRAEVQFALNREAGNIAFSGRFIGEAGSGDFTFTSSDAYAREMTRKGYADLSPGMLLRLALFDVTTAFIEELESLGYGDLSIDDLMASRIHGVSPEFIRSLQALGYTGLPHDQLVAMRIHGASPEFIASMNDLGLRPAACRRSPFYAHPRRHS